MKPTLLCGSLAYDRIMDFDGNFSEHFLADKLHSINLSFFVSPPKEEFGGTAGNIAYGLSLLDTPSALITTVGTDFEEYEAHLKEHNIDCSLLARSTLPTASAYIMTDRADNQIAAFSGAAIMEHYRGEIPYASYGLAVVSATNKDDMVRIAGEAKAAEIPLFFDPGQQIPVLAADELQSAIEGAAGVFFNDYECSLVEQKTGWDKKEIAARTGFLLVTNGPEGVRIITKETEEQVPAVLTHGVKDPTGAGDAFRAGFLAGFARKLPLTTCAKLGSAVAVYAVECYGTQNHRFTLEELAVRYQGAYQESFPL